MLSPPFSIGSAIFLHLFAYFVLILLSSFFRPDFQASKAGNWVGRWGSVSWWLSEPTSPERARTFFGKLWWKPDGFLPGLHEDQCAGPSRCEHAGGSADAD